MSIGDATADANSNFSDKQLNSPRQPCDVFIGTLRGQEVILPRVQKKRIHYTKRDREEYKKLRGEFNSKHRANFVRDLANDPKKIAQLKEAGLTDAEIGMMRDGKIPQGWQVHHKIPLDDGGTNDPSNFVLIKNDPAHLTLTRAQDELVGDLEVGQTREVDFPIPDGFIYPPHVDLVVSE